MEKDGPALAADNPALTSPASHRLPPTTTTTTTTSADADIDIEAATPKNERGWRRIVRNFSPSWFSITMGTGIVALTLATYPYRAAWLHYLSIVFFVLNALLFFLFTLVSILRYALWPEIWAVMLADPTNSLFLGTVPMGFATLIEMWVFVGVPAFGAWAATLAWALWLVDALAAAATTVFLIFKHISTTPPPSTTPAPTSTTSSAETAPPPPPLSRMTATQLLPIAATIVASGTGAEVAATLRSPAAALGTLLASFALWGLATPLAAAVLAMYFQRLHVHKLPPREAVVSSFLPLGPLGFGGYAAAYMGKVARGAFPATATLAPLAGEVLYVLGLAVALGMWGAALAWLVFALATIWTSRPVPFNMGWWGFVFPLGVFAASTVLVGEELPSRAFRVLGAVLGGVVVLLWVVVAAGTVRGAWSGRLFHAPCLAELSRARDREE